MERGTDETEVEMLVEKIRENDEGSMIISPLELNLLMEHCEEIEPFYNIIHLHARSMPEHPSLEDLRFLKLFPKTRKLTIYDRKECDPIEAKSMTFDGIQNCLDLETVHSNCLMLPPILSGIEFCTNLRVFMIGVVYNGDQPMNITPLSKLSFLKSILVGPVSYGLRPADCLRPLVETDGLDLSGCRSLESLCIRPTSKDFRFLGSVQLKILQTPHSGIESLDGLDTTKLISIYLENNRIACVEKLRGANLRGHLADRCLGNNPIDPDFLEEISNSWV